MDPAPVFPSFVVHANTPEAAFGKEGGIAIACPSPVRLGNRTPFALHGVFVLPGEEARAFSRHLLRGVVVLLRGPMPATRSVGEGQVLFDDDLIEKGGLVRGYFNIDMFTLFELIREPCHYWVSASILGQVSNIVGVEVVP
jgi:hypothetical protein